LTLTLFNTCVSLREETSGSNGGEYEGDSSVRCSAMQSRVATAVGKEDRTALHPRKLSPSTAEVQCKCSAYGSRVTDLQGTSDDLFEPLRTLGTLQRVTTICASFNRQRKLLDPRAH